MVSKLKASVAILPGLILLVVSAHAWGQESVAWNLWRILEAADVIAQQEQLAAIELPESIDTQQAVELPVAILDALTPGDHLALDMAGKQSFSYTITERRNYLNGDTGLRAEFRDADQFFSLTLTRSSQLLLATIYAPDGKYQLQAIADGQYYTGWLYSLSRDLRYTAIDEGGFFAQQTSEFNELVDQSALSNSDVTIIQTLSTSNATVGDQVEVTVQVTNNLGTTISDESLNVLFILDEADLVGASSNCSEGSTGSQTTLECSLPNIASGASTSISYTILVTDQSYPQLASGAFVGDIFDEDNHVRDDAFIFVSADTLTDSDDDGISDYNELISDTDPDDSNSTIDPNVDSEVDLMFLYTQRFLDDLNHPFPETEINQLVETTNGYYATSGVNIRFRPVHYGFTEYQVANNLDATMSAMTFGNEPAFQSLSSTRANLGADIVVLIDGKLDGGNTCGLATTGGVGFNGELFHPLLSNPELFVTLYKDGFPQSGGSGCDDLTLAHELGHNFGLVHSEREAGSEGTFSWSRGHGVDGSFATIMAYTTHYPGSEQVPFFSDPTSNNCNGLPCGVSRDDVALAADSVHSLNHTRFQVANRRQSRLLDITAANGHGSNVIMYGGATRNGDTETDLSTFSSEDSIDVRATMAIPGPHRGEIGQTYIVISVDDAAFYYRDHLGGYQSWDGDLNTLGGNIEPRELNANEELVAFNDFVPASVGVTSASLTVFFAFTIADNPDVLVYSSNGIPVNIQP